MILYKLILCGSFVTVCLFGGKVAFQGETDTVLSEVELWETFGTAFNECVSGEEGSCIVEFESCGFYDLFADCDEGYQERNPSGAQISKCMSGAPEEWCTSSGLNFCLQYQACEPLTDPETEEFTSCVDGVWAWIDWATAPEYIDGIGCGGV